MTKKEIINKSAGYFFMFCACLFYASSTAFFLAPNSIIAGGISGLAVLLNFVNANLQIGLMIILLNVPILIVGIKMMGWAFTLKCLLTIAILGVATDLLDLLPALTEDKILACLYGGLSQGVGIGLFVRFQFSSGGTELLGQIVSRATKVIKVPVCVGILDGIIVIVGAIITKNPDNMLYALIVIFVSTKVSEIVLVGIEKSKLCIIITDKGKEISDALITASPRGVTMLDGKGMYTDKDHDVLFTCVKNRQLPQLKQIIKSVDENAFVIVNESVEVRGKGFKRLDE